MKEQSCPSTGCFYWGKYEVCSCERVTRSGTASSLEECRVYQRLKKEQERKPKSQYDSMVRRCWLDECGKI